MTLIIRMLTCFLICIGSCYSPAFSKSIEGPEAETSSPNSNLIQSLIAELGSDEYLKRRDAEMRLVNLGASAFDELQAAEVHPDLEIASRARYILYQIRVQWIRHDDPPAIRNVFNSYGTLSVEDRREVILSLKKKLREEYLGPLCRIARFDPSPLLAREAALLVLQESKNPQNNTSDARTTILREIGEGQSHPIQWLRILADQILDRRQVDPRWLPAIDTEIKFLNEGSEDTQAQLVINLLKFLRQLGAHRNDSHAVFQCLLRWTDLMSERDALENKSQGLMFSVLDTLIWNLQDAEGTAHASQASSAAWAIQNEQWEAIRLLEQHFGSDFTEDRLLLYLSAIAEDQQGNQARAEELFKQVFEMELQEPDLHNDFATIIGALGRHDLAEREWRYVMEHNPLTEAASLLACESLVLYRLHDRQEYQEGVDLLSQAIQAVEADPVIKESLLNESQTRALVERALPCRKAYMQAFASKAKGDHEEERKYLEQALQYNRTDPDILIAMYRSEGADKAYREKVQKRIASFAKSYENVIESNRLINNPQVFNIYAWLVSNTEGNYQKAVQYSLRSLELQPGDPSYLDTLGRCYYAVGDLDNAIKHQRQAVAKHPHMQVMQRQLALFEKEKANRKHLPPPR